VTLVFKLPYYTQWGQSLLIAGSEPALGSWNVKQGLSLSPVHQGNELIWSGRVSVATGFTCQYNYYVVDDNKNVLRSESGEKRKLVLPEGVQDGDVVEIRDWWQDASEALFLRSAFKNVIFNGSENAKRELKTTSLNKSLEPEDIVVQFIVSCPRLGAGSTVVVTGSNPQLGRWQTQDGLKLNYVGDSIWKANCLLRKSEFPIKYPCANEYSLTSNLHVEITI
jgi:4-alpha-glucanotransferase